MRHEVVKLRARSNRYFLFQYFEYVLRGLLVSNLKKNLVETRYLFVSPKGFKPSHYKYSF